MSYRVNRMSLGRRIQLAESIRDLAAELEFAQAGQTTADQVRAAATAAKIDLAYLRWGLADISGILIDGAEATADSLYEAGPEDLLYEVIGEIKRECGLTEDERKN